MSTVRYLAFAVAAAACHHEPSPPLAPLPPLPAVTQASPEIAKAELARGEYVAKIAGCTTCHGKDLAGGMEIPMGAGIARIPNVSNDRETGIGTWSDAQVTAAIRIGVRPDGAHLAPVMPYAFYNRMTDADTAAVVAYMRAQPAVRRQVARSENLPMRSVEMAAPRGGVDRTEDPRAHGEYLATLMHCGACHTPRDGAFADHAFAGGMAFPGPSGSVIASNITSDRDTGIGTFGEADIVEAVRGMKAPNGQALRAPMANYADAWSQLADSDAHALAVFVKSIPPIHHDVNTETPPAVTQKP